jgi:hypothetical protein
MIQYSRILFQERPRALRRTILAASTNKKVLVSRFDREPVTGFVNPQAWLQDSGIELLSTSGSILVLPYPEVKIVSFVRDFEQAEPRRELRTFTTRPKMEGLWVRLTFRDGDAMDGILSNNLLQLEPQGFSVIPPDPEYQNQRVFVPRAALQGIQVLGVVGSPLTIGRRKKPPPKEQIQLFDK